MGQRRYRLLPITICAILCLAVLTACNAASGNSSSNGSAAASTGSNDGSGSSSNTNAGGGGSNTGTGGGGGSTGGPPPGSFQSVQHIVFMAQENEGFDHYYGQINNYRASLRLPTNVDVTPANPEPNVAFGGTSIDGETCPIGGSPIPPFHLRTVCLQNLSPFWNESHVSFNLNDPTSAKFVGNGFAWTAGNYASTSPDVPTAPGVGPRDVCGYRSMGYYDQSDLNYYYFMTTQYAIADNWFAPAPTRTQVNRIYLYAATSHGYVSQPPAQLDVPTIFDRLQAAGVSWKIYYTDCYGKVDARQPGVTCQPAVQDQYYNNFSTSNNPVVQQKVRPIWEYFSDLKNNTLPSVVLIEGGYEIGVDEHPKSNAQAGAAYVKSLIDALQASSSWSSSIFVLTYDEGGDFYDHVAPLTVPSPDGIQPVDAAGTVCPSGPACDFTRTGFRLPVMIVSPFVTPHAVTHTGYDNTAILKLIESRFLRDTSGSPVPLTQRDASMPDLSVDPGLFDWSAPNLAIPNIPSQATNGTCDQFAFTP